MIANPQCCDGYPTFEQQRPGFSLIELLVVIAIIGILVALLLLPYLAQFGTEGLLFLLGRRVFVVIADGIDFGFLCGRHWVARTCSTSEVPIPNASAPNAPCVLV